MKRHQLITISMVAGFALWVLTSPRTSGMLFYAILSKGFFPNLPLTFIGIFILFGIIGTVQYRFAPITTTNIYGTLVYLLPFALLYFALLSIITPTFQSNPPIFQPARAEYKIRLIKKNANPNFSQKAWKSE